jgi:hypothetical protein
MGSLRRGETREPSVGGAQGTRWVLPLAENGEAEGTRSRRTGAGRIDQASMPRLPYVEPVQIRPASTDDALSRAAALTPAAALKDN